MEDPGTSNAALKTARLLQLFDSALPNGGYAHSQGLEALVQAGEIFDEASFELFLREEFTDSLKGLELPLFREAFALAEDRHWNAFGELDDLAWALRATREQRQAAGAVGRQTLLLFGRVIAADAPESASLGQLEEHLTHFQAPVVMGAMASLLGLSLEIALAAYAQQLLTALILPAIKLLQFGPAQTQRLIFRMGAQVPTWVAESLTVPRDAIGSLAPRWEIASANHAYAERRLFIS